MKILISFCNAKSISELTTNGTSPLGFLNTNTGQLHWIKLPTNIDFNNITGLTQNHTHIFTAFSGNQTGIFTISKTNPNMIVTNLLRNIKDPHSITIKDDYLYIVSTGTDTVFKHKILSNGTIITKGTKHWKPKGSKGNIDTSINNNNYICQSDTSSILQNGKKYLQLDSGYVRGLILKDNQICIGISSGKLVLGNYKKYFFYDFSTFHNEIYALIETNLSLPTNSPIIVLNKFKANYNSVTQTINTSSPVVVGWQTYLPKFEFLDSHPELQETTGWAGHKHFAYDIITNLKPKIVVELGTYFGFSLFSMTQAIKDYNLDTKIYGIDTWKGDKHAGSLDNNSYKLVKEIIKIHYKSQKIKLIKSLFSTALKDFKKNSIDLLHIDGLHTYLAVKKDFYSWLPKMSKNGIVMFHDISVTKHDFGVKLLWDEIKEKYKHIDFFHSHGLGIIFLGDLPTFDINTILNSYYSLTSENYNNQIKAIITEKQKIIDQLQSLSAEQKKSLNQLQSSNIKNQETIHSLQQSLNKIQSSKTYIIWQKFNKLKRAVTGKKQT